MPSLEIRKQKLATSLAPLDLLLPSFYFPVPNICGWSVDNPRVNLRTDSTSAHNPAVSVIQDVYKAPGFATFCTQANQFLYTVFQQYYDIFLSVNRRLIHVFPIAYISHDNSKKGIFK